MSLVLVFRNSNLPRLLFVPSAERSTNSSINVHTCDERLLQTVKLSATTIFFFILLCSLPWTLSLLHCLQLLFSTVMKVLKSQADIDCSTVLLMQTLTWYTERKAIASVTITTSHQVFFETVSLPKMTQMLQTSHPIGLGTTLLLYEWRDYFECMRQIILHIPKQTASARSYSVTSSPGESVASPCVLGMFPSFCPSPSKV